MMYFLSILIGLALLLWGLLMTLQATSAMNKTLKGFKALKEDTHYLELSKLREELDELNYSYYEILNDLTQRLDAVESILQGQQGSETNNLQIVHRESVQGLHTTVEPLPFMTVDTHSQKSERDAKRRETIQKLIDQGLTDQEIARALGIGIGEVGILRRTLQNRPVQLPE